jgi:ERCC4-type nuclease
MTAILISPAEPNAIRTQFAALLARVDPDGELYQAAVSGVPERRGVDFAWIARGHWWGVQRKELADLYASLEDGRLEKEIGQMNDSTMMPVIVMERAPQWTTEGVMVASDYGRGRAITYDAWMGLHLSLAARNITVLHSKDHATTCKVILAFIKWSIKPKHLTGMSRPGPTGNEWGQHTSRDWCIHLLQSFPLIGPEVAAQIHDTFGGVPLQWTVTRDQLLAIPGIGPKKADTLIRALRSDDLAT